MPEDHAVRAVLWFFLPMAIVLLSIVIVVSMNATITYLKRRDEEAMEEAKKEREKSYKYFVLAYSTNDIHPLLGEMETDLLPKVGGTIILGEIDDDILCRGKVTAVDQTGIHTHGRANAVWVKIMPEMYDYLITKWEWERRTIIKVPANL